MAPISARCRAQRLATQDAQRLLASASGQAAGLQAWRETIAVDSSVVAGLWRRRSKPPAAARQPFAAPALDLIGRPILDTAFDAAAGTIAGWDAGALVGGPTAYRTCPIASSRQHSSPRPFWSAPDLSSSEQQTCHAESVVILTIVRGGERVFGQRGCACSQLACHTRNRCFHEQAIRGSSSASTASCSRRDHRRE
jgi:hypothetical protein